MPPLQFNVGGSPCHSLAMHGQHNRILLDRAEVLIWKRSMDFGLKHQAFAAFLLSLTSSATC